MRLLLLSDIHANIEALEACLAVAPGYDMVVSLGDVVGYNAAPNEVCARVRALGSISVRGNHDRACAGLMELDSFNALAASITRWTQGVLLPDNLDWLSSLPKGPVRIRALRGVEFVHGSPRDEDEYLLNWFQASTSFQAPGHPGRIVFGHTHVQGGFMLGDGLTRAITPKFAKSDGLVEFRMTLAPGARYLINPGAVGQPRDGDWRAAFALYEGWDEDEPAKVTFYRVPYAIEKAQQRIVSAGLPAELAMRLKLGR